MIKLMSLKKQKENQDHSDKKENSEQQKPQTSSNKSTISANTTTTLASSSTPSISAAERRLQKDLSELDLPTSFNLKFPEKDQVMHFIVHFQPTEGYYQGGHFIFTCHIPETYPHEPPKLHCKQTLFHPNIDLQGNICLNILREDWKPILSLSSILVGLQFLFLEPNAEDPLNKDAAKILKSSPHRFAEYVKRSMRGDYIDGVQYDNVLSQKR